MSVCVCAQSERYHTVCTCVSKVRRGILYHQIMVLESDCA